MHVTICIRVLLIPSCLHRFRNMTHKASHEEILQCRRQRGDREKEEEGEARLSKQRYILCVITTWAVRGPSGV